MFFFSRKPLCFYCGAKSPHAPSPGARAWYCKSCDATNHLDENGNFTDVPASQSTPLNRTHNKSSFSRSPSPNFDFGEEPIFCRKCQQNQHIYQQSLAGYLPDFDDPRYPEFEKALPEFKRNLALRYPQVCVDCAPKAEERLDRAVYVAKTDNARHMLRKSKQNERNIMALGLLNWRSIIIFVAGLAWWLSILGQLIWHLAGLTLTPYAYALSGWGIRDAGLITQCMNEIDAFHFSKVPGLLRANDSPNMIDTSSNCILAFKVIAELAFRLGLASFWWNNRLRDKIVDRRLGHMKGLGEYFKLQILVLLVRWWTLKYLDLPTSLGLQLKAFRGGHILMFLFLSITTYKSGRLVYLDRSTRVNFDTQRKPLMAETQSQLYENGDDQPTASSSSNSPYIDPYHFEVRERQRREDRERVESAVRAREQSQRFSSPNGRFTASSSQNPYNPSPITPLTPPPDEDDSTSDSYDPDNAMEWTPTQAQFQPRRPVQSFAAPTSPQPAQQNLASASYKSPFYGTLPPAPKPPAFRLRNPPQPSFRRQSAEKRNLFQDAVMGRNAEGNEFGSSSRNTNRADLELRPSKWFLESDYVDTGLESAFESVFSLDDMPKEVKTPKKNGFLGGLFG